MSTLETVYQGYRYIMVLFVEFYLIIMSNSIQSNLTNLNNQEVYNIYHCFNFMLNFLIHLKRLRSLYFSIPGTDLDTNTAVENGM